MPRTQGHTRGEAQESTDGVDGGQVGSGADVENTEEVARLEVGSLVAVRADTQDADLDNTSRGSWSLRVGG